MNCIVCGIEINGTFGSGKYCSRSCCNKRSMTKEVREKISKSIKKRNSKKEKKIYYYVCSKCNIEFSSLYPIRKDRLKTCQDCKRKVVYVKDIDNLSLFDISKRTLAKIFKRAGKGCILCGWNEASCDGHHVIPKKDGGKNEHDNFIIVCPNHHRILHSKEKNNYSIEYLLSLTIDKTFPDWKDYYNKHMGK